MRRFVAILIMVALTGLVAACSREDRPTAPVVPSAVTLMSYPATEGSGDNISRAFYIPAFPGKSLATVTLWFSSITAGSYTFRLTARSATFDGTVIGTADQTVNLTANVSDSVRTTFSFANPAVTANSTVTFVITQLVGPGPAFFSVTADVGGLSGAATNLVQTNDSNPPLSSNRRDRVAIKVTGLAP